VTGGTDGPTRQFRTYWVRGASVTRITEDGTIASTAAYGSVPFKPQIGVPQGSDEG